ncbi:MAG: GGDEF domain-containing protein [Lachnospirales bacterium]
MKNYKKIDASIFVLLFFLIIVIITLGFKVNIEMRNYGKISNIASANCALTYEISSEARSSYLYYTYGEFANYRKSYDRILERTGLVNEYFDNIKALTYGDEERGIPAETNKKALESLAEATGQMEIFVAEIKRIIEAPDKITSVDELVNLETLTEETFNQIDSLNTTYEEMFIRYSNIQTILIVSCFILIVSFTFTIIFMNRKIVNVENIAKFDFVTGVYNISYLQSVTKNYIDEGYALIYIDIDHFNDISKKHGNRTCNDILKTVGKRLSKVFEDNLVFRHSGDEFIIFIKEKDVQKLDLYIESIQKDIFSSITDHKGSIHELTATISALGIDVYKNNIYTALNTLDDMMIKARNKNSVNIAHNDDELKELLKKEIETY